MSSREQAPAAYGSQRRHYQPSQQSQYERIRADPENNNRRRIPLNISNINFSYGVGQEEPAFSADLVTVSTRRKTQRSKREVAVKKVPMEAVAERAEPIFAQEQD